jgi:TRAP-type transport system periplasmic protein
MRYAQGAERHDLASGRKNGRSDMTGTALNRRALLGGAAGALGIATTRSASAATPTVLKFSHTDTQVGARQQAAELFAKRVQALTDGRYVVQIYPAGQLASDAQSLEQMRLGGVDFAVTGAGTYATYVKTFNLTVLPFLVDSYEQGWKLYDESPWLTQQSEALTGKGMRILSTWEAGFRSFTTKTPLHTPADAKGKKIRIFPNQMIRWIMEAFGFATVVLPVTDVYLAIQQGAVSGQENPIDTIYSQKFYEVAPYITLTQHVYSPIPMAVAESTWRKFSAADQAAVKQAAREAATFSRTTVKGGDEDQLKEMTAKGAKVERPNLAPWKKAAEAVYAEARKVYGKDVDAFLADAGKVRAALPSRA